MNTFTMKQLFERGWTETTVPTGVDEGKLTRLRRGAFVEGSDDGRAQLVAGAAACSPESVLSHASAALLHELPVRKDARTCVHLTRTRASGGRVDRDVHLYSCPVRDDEVLYFGDLKATDLARTVVDLARHEPPEWALAAGDAALRAGMTSGELKRQLRRAKGRPGIRRARVVAGLFDARAESAGESISRWLIREGGFPMPELQVELNSHGEVVRVDFFWRELNVVGEFDGRIKYGRSLTPHQDPSDVLFAEKRREDGLRAEGYVVVRWIWDDLVDPQRLFALLRKGFTLAERLA